MKKHSLYKFFSDRGWADAFLEGEVFFNALAFFRDYEDAGVRGDSNEGSAVYRPTGGLVVNNLTQRRTFTLPAHAFTSTTKQEEIFVFCASRSMSERMRKEFKAAACVEIADVAAFCRRVAAALPSATFPGKPGNRRIGHAVTYYPTTEGGNPRWAVPDFIATSKLEDYSWQNEYRLVFSLTDALSFQKVIPKLVPDGVPAPPKAASHPSHIVKAGSLRDFCTLHEL